MPFDALHARYPFLGSAREAVEEAGVDIAAAVAEEGRAVDRAVERVRTAVREGTVGPPRRDARTELLSYPVARVLVSLVGSEPLVERYATAEAATARERFEADQAADLRSVDRRSLDLSDLLADLGLSAVSPAPDGDGFRVGVATYLRLAAGRGGDWRLVAREPDDGTVPVSEAELLDLVESAVADQVAEGLPLSVPDAVADPLAGEAERVREALGGHDLRVEADAVVPALFPPCVRALLDQARDGDRLPDRSRFALAAFLTAAGLDAEEAAALAGDETLAVEAEALDGAYPPPSCATMQAQGDCVNKDERCERIDHPLSYYDDAVAAADGVTDWRQRRESR